MKPTLIIFSILAVLCTTTEAVNFFKYLLCGGRDSNYRTDRVLPLDYGVEKVEEGTPNSSDRVSVNENEDVTNNGGINEEEVNQQRENPLKTKTKKVKKNKHDKNNNIAVPFWDLENSQVAVKKPKTVLGDNAKIIRDLLGPHGVCINLKDLSEQSASELLKIRRHMITVLDPDNRFDFLIKLPELFDYKSEVSLNNAEKLYYDIDDELVNVRNLKEFLRIVINFYKTLGANIILKDCIKAILNSAIFTTDELPQVLQMTFDQIFQFACINGFDALAIELVQTKAAEELNLYRGVVRVFSERNEKLGHELLSIIGKKYGNEPGSVYYRVCDHLNVEEIEIKEEKS